jgi:uncharacterized membrane protein YedE/YeeE
MMPRYLATVLGAGLAGLVFGLGLAIAEMINPAKVLAFLDIAGNWDPSLALVMAAAAGIAYLGTRLALAEGKPVYADKFSLPTAAKIDARLLIGAAIFGIGWGIGGLCPGPGIASIAYGGFESLFFLTAMGLGLYSAGEIA